MDKSKRRLKAILVKPPSNPIDVQGVLNIGCSIFKEMFNYKRNIKVVDFIVRPYGCWVIIEVPSDVERLLKLR